MTTRMIRIPGISEFRGMGKWISFNKFAKLSNMTIDQREVYWNELQVSKFLPTQTGENTKQTILVVKIMSDKFVTNGTKEIWDALNILRDAGFDVDVEKISHGSTSKPISSETNEKTDNHKLIESLNDIATMNEDLGMYGAAEQIRKGVLIMEKFQ